MLHAPRTGRPGATSAMLKLRSRGPRPALTRLALGLIERDALAWEPWRPLHGLNAPTLLPEDRLAALPLFWELRTCTTHGGAAEIRRDILAEKVQGR